MTGPSVSDERAASAPDRRAWPLVVELTAPAASDPGLVGAKAASLARAAAAGLPVLPGAVLTTAATARWKPGEEPDDEVLDEARRAWERLGGEGRAFVVRSSSTIEDTAHSSMAGRFRSVLDVRGWAAMRAAIAAVRDSARRVPGPDGGPAPLAVLLQPQLPTRCGGVLFGLDPVDGDRRHLVAEYVEDNPDAVVSGRATATRIVLSRHGRQLDRDGDAAPLGRRHRRQLARMAAAVEAVFDGPQDVEWAIGAEDATLRLLQSRPVTAAGERPAPGPLLGPGPLLETFPEPLRRLEVDLWLAPIRRGISEALRVTGAVPEKHLASSPVALAVDGWAAVDLDLIEAGRRRRRFGPLSAGRLLASAWRVGRLRAALPELARDLMGKVDDHLADVPGLPALSDVELVTLLENAVDELAAVHGYEVLAGMLLPPDPTAVPAPAAGLSTLARSRAQGATDAEVIGQDPLVLALEPPRFGGTRSLPAAPRSPMIGTGAHLDLRDGLRLRTRWLQELTARAAHETGVRLVRLGHLDRPELVREATLDELQRAVRTGAPLPRDLEDRARQPAGPPLPTRFRLTSSGRPVAVRRRGAASEGRGAGGGRAVGTVRHRPVGGGASTGPESPANGAADHRGGDVVLVVASLDPGLAATLPSLRGLVAETGSALSHLAILAREMGVATVVGVPDARARFPQGARLLVDGSTGEVRVLDEEGAMAGTGAGR